MKIPIIVTVLLAFTIFLSDICFSKESEEHYQRGLGYLETGIVDKALDEFKKALPLFKEEKNQKMVAEVYVALANVYNWTGIYKTAITVCKQAIEINPNLAYAHYNLGFALREEGEIGLAKNEFALYNELLKEQGELVEISEGKALETADKDVKSVETTKKTDSVSGLSESDETVKSASVDEHIRKGVEYYNNGMLDEAIGEFQEALEDDPDDVTIHFNLGNAYVDNEMFEEAISEYEKVIEIDPTNIDAILDLGMLYLDFDQTDEALSLYSNASKSNPDNPYLHYHLGEVYARKQRYDKAILEFKRALAINNMDPEIQYRLAQTYNETKQFGLALEHVTRARELGYLVDQKFVDELKRKTQ